MVTIGLVFSRDRPLQLDGMLRSLRRHCRDLAELRLTVVYRATSRHQRSAYAVLARDHVATARFVPESSFEDDVREALVGSDRDDALVLLLVDDVVLVRPFTLAAAATALGSQDRALALSLRLGHNTTFVQPRGEIVPAADLALVGGDGDDALLRTRWTEAQGDFGYPFDLSCSLYRGADITDALRDIRFDGPNLLEHRLWERREAFVDRPFLLLHRRARGFAIPANRVQDVAPNPTSGSARHSPQRLLQAYRRGWRLDVAAYDGFSPPTCHFEIDLLLRRPAPVAGRGARE
jgi:hypothetical protein